MNSYENYFLLEEMDPIGEAKVRSFFEEPYVPIPLSEDERNKLKGCKCGWNPNVPIGGHGWVECDGMGGFRIVIQPLENLGPEYTNCQACEVDSCVRSHEERHIDQFAEFCPFACIEKATLLPPEVILGVPCPKLKLDFRNGGILGFEEGKCNDLAECYAYKVEMDCLEKLRFAKSRVNCRGRPLRRCNDFIKDIMERKKAEAEGRFHCEGVYRFNLDPTKKPKG